MWLIRTLSSSLGKKYIMACTGLLLGCFLLVHAAGNTTIFLGREMFLSYAEHLHSLGFLVHLAELALLTVFFLHVVTALMLFVGNRGARPSRYAVQRSAGGRSWGSKSMPWTGLVILAFILVHLANFHFRDPDRSIADLVAAVLGRPSYTLLYVVGLTALGLHISHGFWSLFQSLGVNHPKYDGLIRGGGLVLSALIGAVFWGIVLLLLINGKYLL